MILRFTEGKSGISISNMYTSSYRITDVYIDYYTNYTAYKPDSEPGGNTYTIENISDPGVYYSTTVDAEDLCLKFGIDSLDNGLFYVWMVYKDTSAEPGEDIIFEGMLADYDGLNYAGIRLTEDYYYSDNCSVPSSFEEFCLAWNAIKIAVETEDWELLNKLWAKILGNDNLDVECPCNR